MAYLPLGPTPCDEDCAQVGQDDYGERNREECRRYIELLQKKFTLPDGMYFKRKGFPHDFGTYHEVVVVYDETDEEHESFAFEIEDNLPARWED